MTNTPAPHNGITSQPWMGTPYPLGASYDGQGTNFSLFSSVADGVELCLLGGTDADGRHDEVRVEIEEVEGHIWHAYLPDVRPGQHYGWRVHGPWQPDKGLWCNDSKLLIDPYAKTLDGEVDWSPACFGYDFDDPDKPNTDNSAPHVPLAVVADPYFEWGNDHSPNRPMHETVIYETHVRGLTMQHPGVPEALRGTYAGLAHPAIIEHLQRLGITAVELMPVHQFINDHFLFQKGLRNYWGYNSVGYLAPHNAYASRAVNGQVQEFKAMVRELHAAGIEVILDVVYNHTAEGNDLGPTLSMRGIDNPAYYRLQDDNPRKYLDFTGTGNSMNMRHPHVLQLIMDSLRYWYLYMHVDGFRFDLASALARELYEVDRLSAFFDIVQQDPVISQVKLIAEPWDVGEGGYQVGKFPPHWSEWNGKYRDTIRDFWRGEPATLAEFGYRFTGSSDLYEADTRKPTASINFITCHDGFTMRDLVSYNDKHNEANGEGNRDGESHNRSWNCGVEGPTDIPEIVTLRDRQRRNMAATLLLSQGVPMVLGGDELGRTQGGNNNAYCQDNAVSWYDWSDVDVAYLEWMRRVIEMRADHPVFRRRRWFQGRAIRGVDDMAWFKADGNEMNDDDWDSGYAKSVGVFINGNSIQARDQYGDRVVDDSFFLICNASELDLKWTLPLAHWGGTWLVELDSVDPSVGAQGTPPTTHAAGEVIEIANRSLVLMRAIGDSTPDTNDDSPRRDSSTIRVESTVRPAAPRRDREGDGRV